MGAGGSSPGGGAPRGGSPPGAGPLEGWALSLPRRHWEPAAAPAPPARAARGSPPGCSAFRPGPARGGYSDALAVRAAAAADATPPAEDGAAVSPAAPQTGTPSSCFLAAPRAAGVAAALALLVATCGLLAAGGAAPWRGRAAAQDAPHRRERPGQALVRRPAPAAAGARRAEQHPPAELCGGMEEDVDIWTWAQLAELPGVAGGRACRDECSGDARCAAWTWGSERGVEGLTDVCFLKGLKPGVAPQRRPTPGVVSGLRCGGPGGGGGAGPAGAGGAQGSAGRPGLPPGGGGDDSLFCFSVMLPEGYERGLVEVQHRRNISIFACDGWSVYSSREVEVAPGLVTGKVGSNLTCGYGGEFNTALNLEIFMLVWVKVISDGAFHNFGWTAKVDPDSVFFPDRLRMVVRRHMEDAASPSGVYLNNCKFGLHGPLEVFSRNAVETWAKGSAHCVSHFNDACSGDCMWGEDLFIDQCLWKVLNVSREDDDALLVEDHCQPPEGWESCDNSTFVAYHPFKEISSYEACWGNSQSGGVDAFHA